MVRSKSNLKNAICDMATALRDVFKEYPRSIRKQAWKKLISTQGQHEIEKVLNQTSRPISRFRMLQFSEWLNLQEGRQVPIENLFQQIYESVSYLNSNLEDSHWKLIDTRNLLPADPDQKYGNCEMHGENIRWKGDRYYLKVFYRLRKSDQPIKFYDSEKGHPLLVFHGFIEGWRGGMAPDREIDWETSSAIKGYPIPVSKPGDFRNPMERIGSFYFKKLDWETDVGINTPFEIAKWVEKKIQNWNRGGNDEDQEPSPEPSPEADFVKT
jgi:hypothetical protein